MAKYSFREIISLPLMGLMYLFSFLPLQVLYGISWVLSWLLRSIFRYRLDIVRENLRNSFPQKSAEELRVIEKNFYRHFSDVMMEVLKLKTISASELKRRCSYDKASVELLNTYHQQGISIIIVMAHTGNWEWAGASYPLHNRHQIITAYRPLRNKSFDQYTRKMRMRTGNIMVSMKNLPREMIKMRNQVFGTALIGDQTPPKNSGYWIRFMNQETPIFKGTEKLSQKFNTPLFWGCVTKRARGYYHIELQLITDTPRSFTQEGSLTCLHASFLEKDIQAHPENWLWSHRRWKHQRPENVPLIDECD